MLESFAQRLLQTGGLVVRLPMGRRLVLGDAGSQLLGAQVPDKCDQVGRLAGGKIAVGRHLGSDD